MSDLQTQRMAENEGAAVALLKRAVELDIAKYAIAKYRYCQVWILPIKDIAKKGYCQTWILHLYYDERRDIRGNIA